MIRCKFFKGKNVLVFGLGRTGLGSIKSMIESGATVFASDDDLKVKERYQDSFPEVTFVNIGELKRNEVDYIILSPGISKKHDVVVFAERHKIEIISDLDVLYLVNPDARYIGITGTNGKSTTTALTGHILNSVGLSVAVGGNIGNSVLELDPLSENHVIEVSSFQLDIIKYIEFDISMLLNITPDHLDRHGNMENYISAKKNIFNGHNEKKKNRVAIISVDSFDTLEIYNTLENTVTVSVTKDNADISIVNRVLYDNINKLEFDLGDYRYLQGRHNEENIAFAYAAAIKIGVDPEAVVKYIKTFTGLKHRAQEIFRKNELVFINDSKATNAVASEKAINCFDNIYWIVGGVLKEGGINALTPLFSKINRVYLIGASQDEFAETLSEYKMKFKKVGTLDVALDEIKIDTQLEIIPEAPILRTVLLSPACASYDQFKDFEHRGDEFIRLVKEKFQ
jgi:UDP-N-acetylmuramoylalanine--D-glutamate ligase